MIAFAVKAVVLIADPNPQFFLGDSGSYLHTALTGSIPPDRSFLYGYLIRWFCVGSASLFSLVLVQMLASAVSAGILGWILLRFIGIARPIATVAVMLYSLDPLPLMYERFVMAETFSLAAAMLFVNFLFLFVDLGLNRYLIFASIAGVVTVALRMSFLPPVVALSFAAPVIRFLFNNADKWRNFQAPLKALLASLAVVAISHFAFHGGYKLLNGRLSGAPPAYQYADGLSVLSSWCPVLMAEDLQAFGVSDHIFEGTVPRTLESRRAHRWMQNGIVVALNHSYKDAKKANAVAKKISWHILRRDPLGVITLAIRTYLRGWRRDVIKRSIKEDTGERAIPPQLVQQAAKYFHVVAGDMATRRTLTKSYFRRGIEWYRALLLTPLLLALTTLFCESRYRPFLVIVTLYSGIVLLTAIGLAVDNSIRYLHPLGWTFFLFTAYWADALTRRIRLTSRPALISP